MTNVPFKLRGCPTSNVDPFSANDSSCMHSLACLQPGAGWARGHKLNSSVSY